MEEPMENPKNNPKLPTNSGEKAGPKVIQRWSAARKREIVLRLLRGESLDAVSREIGVEVYRLERWRDKALAAMDAGLKERADDDPAPGRSRRRPQAGRRAEHGERTAARQDRAPGDWHPFSPGEVAQMSAATSPSTHRPYGVQRVCRIWAVPRSTFYQASRPADSASRQATRSQAAGR